MATTITRTSMTDDDGTGTTGTVFNAAWKTEFYDQIDALFTSSANSTKTFGVTNSSSGAAASAQLLATNNASKVLALEIFSSGFTPALDALASGARVLASGVGGLSISAADAAGEIRFYTGGFNKRWTVNASGHILAATDNSYDIGASGANRPRGVYIAGSLTLPGATLLATSSALTNGAGALTGTLTNSPATGNPTKWIPINDNGTVRYFPAW
jgi:hypothetical protein